MDLYEIIMLIGRKEEVIKCWGRSESYSRYYQKNPEFLKVLPGIALPYASVFWLIFVKLYCLSSENHLNIFKHILFHRGEIKKIKENKKK